MPGQPAGLPDQAIAFYLFAMMAIVSAWAIVFSKNLVRSASLLLLTLGGVAGLFFLLKQEFLAAVQLIVYAGGTLILIIFTVLLTARANQPQRISRWGGLLSVFAGVAAVAGLGIVFCVFTAVPDQAVQPHETGGVPGVGRAMLSTYLVPFQVTGLVLLLVMIGASYLARKTRPIPLQSGAEGRVK